MAGNGPTPRWTRRVSAQVPAAMKEALAGEVARRAAAGDACDESSVVRDWLECGHAGRLSVDLARTPRGAGDLCTSTISTQVSVATKDRLTAERTRREKVQGRKVGESEVIRAWLELGALVAGWSFE